MRSGITMRVLLKIPTVICLLLTFASGHSPIRAQLSEWDVSTTPLVSAGDGEGEGHQLLFVRDAVLRADGILVVLSGGTKDLRVYSATGDFLQSVGREGEGPGEFKTPRGISLLPSGHLLVYDPGNLRVTEFDEDLEVLGSHRIAYPISAMAPAFGRNRPMWNGMVPVASYDTPFFESTRRREGVYEENLVIQLFREDKAEATVRRPRGPVYLAKDGNSGLTLPVPMGEFALFNWGPEQVVLGTSHSSRFEVFDTTGNMVQTFLAQGSPRRATSEDMAAFDRKFRAERQGSFAPPGFRPQSMDVRVKRYLDNAPRGRTVPMFDQVEVADEGQIWVREYLIDGETRSWQVLDPLTQSMIGRVTIPAQWEVLRVASSHLVVLERDEYDIELIEARENPAEGLQPTE